MTDRASLETPRRAALIGIATLAVACAGAPDATPGATPSAVDASPVPLNTPNLVPAPTPVPLPTVEDVGGTLATVTGDPDWVIVVDGTPWTTTTAGLLPLDPVTGAPGTAVPVMGITCTALDAGFDSIWAATCANHSLSRVDPLTARVTTRIELPTDGDVAEEGSVGAGEGGVWVVTTDPTLVKVDPTSNKVAGTWPLPPGAAAVRAGLGWLWVTVPNANQVYRIDPDDPDSRLKIRVGAGPRFLAIGEGAVWTMDASDGTVTKVLPDGTVAATIDVADEPIRGGDIAVGGGYVWARTWDSLVVRIDPVTGETIRLGPVSGSGSVAADDTAAWISAHDVSAVWRLPLPFEATATP